MSRSIKKGPFVDKKLLKKITKTDKNSNQVIKTWARNSMISPEMVGYKIGIHNGKEHITIRVNEDMVGHRLGEFAPTRKFIKHGGQLQRAVEKKQSGK